MGQATLYLKDEIAKRVRKEAKKSKLSQSQWLLHLIEKELEDQWPRNVIQLAGSWGDFPSLKEIRSQDGEDSPRGTL